MGGGRGFQWLDQYSLSLSVPGFRKCEKQKMRGVPPIESSARRAAIHRRRTAMALLCKLPTIDDDDDVDDDDRYRPPLPPTPRGDRETLNCWLVMALGFDLSMVYWLLFFFMSTLFDLVCSRGAIEVDFQVENPKLSCLESKVQSS